MKTSGSVNRLPAVPGRSLMNITRRFAVASLLVIAVAVVLGASAPASAGAVKLSPPTDGPFPNASGQYQVYWSSIYPPGPAGSLNSVSVSKLAPNTSYYIPLYYARWSSDEHGYPVFLGWVLYHFSFQTDAHGAFKSGISKGGYGAIVYVMPAVYDSSTGTLVLTSSP
jgi:hypothetical protein